MSPFLALGCVSPRTIMDCLDAHEAKFGESDNTYWVRALLLSSKQPLTSGQVRFEMLWRDYFLFIGRKFGTALFKLGGLEEITDPKQARIKTWPGWWNTWDQDGPADQPAVRWMEGKTGVPFIDANMVSLSSIFRLRVLTLRSPSFASQDSCQIAAARTSQVS